ncbi:hypothetical protein FQZ97_1057920 [compost metagenome]
MMAGLFLSAVYCSEGTHSIMSTSPLASALACVCASFRTIHSMRSTYTFLPPAVPDGASARGTYLEFFR